jgi:murein DD-endopeptidase MepM/ murein hydrolase activator NlpD
MKKNKYFTIMILPGHASKVRRYTFPKILLRYLGYLSLVVLFVSIYLLYNYVDMKGKVWELDSLRKEAESQRIMIQSFASGLVDVKKQMERIRAMDLKLKHLTGSYRRSGQGGSPATGERLKDLGATKQEGDLKQIHNELNILKEEASGRETSLQRLLEFFDGYRYRKSSSPSLWPVKGLITSSFGYRESPFSGNKEFHSGIDISCAIGTSVLAPADGFVSYIGYNEGLGRFLELDHGYGITTIYGHLSKTAVEVGKKVTRGQVIGHCGSSGTTTGPHLHYEVRLHGAPINPFKFIL